MTKTTPPSSSSRRSLLAWVVGVAGVTTWFAATSAAEQAVMVPAPAGDAMTATGAATTETAVLAGGCFWGVQGVFQHVQGVVSAVSGYAGGDQKTARYEAVGSGTTGHAEAVKVVYDPRKVSYAQLLQIYFSVAHNPTELNRQGPDSGTQYRSTVFAADAAQDKAARAYIAQIDRAKVFGKPLATTIEPLKAFYPAEAYHQDFLLRNPRHPYIVINDMPKVEDLKRMFASAYRADPVRVLTKDS